MKFHVDNYTPNDGDLGESDAKIELLAGAGSLKHYTIPKSAKDDAGQTIFTIDASDGTVYDGDYTYGPFIYYDYFMTGKTDWSASMDRDGWSKVPGGGVIYAMGATDLNHLHRVSSAKYYKVQPTSIKVKHKYTQWGDQLHGGDWAMCPEGSWLRGLYRVGSKFDGSHGTNGGWQLQKALCSRFQGIKKWGKCQEVKIFEEAGRNAALCPTDSNGVPSAFVGFKSSPKVADGGLDSLHTAKCCEFPVDLVKVDPTQLCRKTWQCSWNAKAPPYSV